MWSGRVGAGALRERGPAHVAGAGGGRFLGLAAGVEMAVGRLGEARDHFAKLGRLATLDSRFQRPFHALSIRLRMVTGEYAGLGAEIEEFLRECHDAKDARNYGLGLQYRLLFGWSHGIPGVDSSWPTDVPPPAPSMPSL